MKKSYSLLFAVVLFLSCSCVKVSMDQQIGNIYNYIEKDSDLKDLFDKAPTIADDEIVEYYSYILSKKIKIEDMWTQDFSIEDTLTGPKDCQNLIAEIPGKNKKNQAIIISAPLSDPTACVSAIEIMKTLKKAKVRRNNSIRLLLFDGQEGCHTYRDISRSRNEANLLNLELANMANPYQKFSVFERQDIFDSISEIVPQYLDKYYKCTVEYDDSDRAYVINPHYQFVTDDNDNKSFATFQANTSLAAALVCILN